MFFLGLFPVTNFIFKLVQLIILGKKFEQNWPNLFLNPFILVCILHFVCFSLLRDGSYALCARLNLCIYQLMHTVIVTLRTSLRNPKYIQTYFVNYEKTLQECKNHG